MKTNYKKLLKTFIVFIGIIAIFDFVDFLIHGLSPSFAVPSYYFRNKAIYGTLIAFITYLFVQKKPAFTKALIVSGVTCVLLQLRYFIAGYPLDFVIEFLFIHFAILLIVSWLAFKYVLKR